MRQKRKKDCYLATANWLIDQQLMGKGKGGSWECVGKGRGVDEIGLYSGYSEGRRTAIDLFSIPVNRELLFKTNTILNDINKLCRDVKGICIRRMKCCRS